MEDNTILQSSELLLLLHYLTLLFLLGQDVGDGVGPEPQPVHDVILDERELGVDLEDPGVLAGGEGGPGHRDVLRHGGRRHAGGEEGVRSEGG